MENNKKIRDLYELYIELGHDAFEEKIKKPMENYLHDGSNVITINALNTIIANAMQSSKLGEAGFDEYDIFSPPSFEEKIFFDDTLPPIYDDYNDGCDSFTPTITNETIFTYVESIDTFMHMDHGKNVSCDGYIVDFINDATESFYERGRHDFIYHNNIKSPLFLLKILKLHLLCLPMLVTLCFIDLFSYKIPMHRKWVRLKCV
jgi:hypothetical protein